MSLKAHIAVGTLLGVLLGVGAVTVLSRATSPAASSAEASEPAQASDSEDSEDAVSPAALRRQELADDFRRPMRPGALRRSLQS